MAQHEVEAVYEFGTMASSRSTTSVYLGATQFPQSRIRGSLQNPTLIRNLIHTGRNDLWMPPAAVEHLDLSATFGSRYVRSFYQCTTPGGAWIILFTTDGTNYRIEKVRADGIINSDNGLVGNSWPLTFTPSPGLSAEINIVPSYNGSVWGFTLCGYHQIWELRVEGITNDPITGAPALGLKYYNKYTAGGPGVDPPFGSCQAWFNGRRFVGSTSGYDGTLHRLWYSDPPNTPWSTGATNFLDLVSSSQSGKTSRIMALYPYNDALYIFTESDVWVLRGSESINFDLERLNVNVGVVGNTTIDEDSGIIYFLSMLAGSEGVYAFDGNSTTRISEPINEYFSSNRATGTENLHTFGSTLHIQDKRIILTAGPINPSVDTHAYTETYVGDINEDPMNPKWSVHGQWSSDALIRAGTAFQRNYLYTVAYGSPPYLPLPYLFIGASDKKLYNAPYSFARPPASKGYVVFNYADEEHPFDTKRFLSFKALIWKASGTGIPTLKATFTDASGTTRTSALPITATASGAKTAELVWPVNFRSNSLKIELEITAANDDNGIVLEGVELHYINKRDKGGNN